MRSGQCGGFELVQDGRQVTMTPRARSNHPVMIVSPRGFAFIQEMLQKGGEASDVNERLR